LVGGKRGVVGHTSIGQARKKRTVGEKNDMGKIDCRITAGGDCSRGEGSDVMFHQEAGGASKWGRNPDGEKTIIVWSRWRSCASHSDVRGNWGRAKRSM